MKCALTLVVDEEIEALPGLVLLELVVGDDLGHSERFRGWKVEDVGRAK